MSTTETPTAAPLPDYIASNVPNPISERAAWYKNTAPSYAGVFLWFVFWQDAAKHFTPGGTLAAGLGVALLGVVIAALICHFLFYLVPGLLGLKTGRPLYIVGTSTFGATGGFLMPGFLMGLLQFGWLGVNTYFASLAIASFFNGSIPAEAIMIVYGIGAAFIGLAGIKYVATVATYLPLIPLVTLIWLTVKTIGGVGSFEPENLIDTQTAAGMTGAPISAMTIITLLISYIVGFFATAGAAGVDFGMANRDERDVHMGGIVGIALTILVTAGLSILIVAGTYGAESTRTAAADRAATAIATIDASDQTPAQKEAAKASVQANMANSVQLIPAILGDGPARWLFLLLAIAAFPSACFSSLIAANSFKTTLPKVNPFLSVGVGAIIAVGLALSGYAGDAAGVFGIIGASFGPIVGAMVVDYFLAGQRWTGPRAGFNPAGWIAWLLGFAVGITPNLSKVYPSIPAIPAAPVVAFLVGAVVYFICMSIGLKSRVLDLPTGTDVRTTPTV